MARHLELGAIGEDLVARHYERHGYLVVARNWRCPDGELDVVARRGALVAFCEVKTRSNDRFGGGAAAVGVTRQRRLRHAAMAWMRERDGSAWVDVRFDVAVVRVRGETFSIEMIEAAF
ncbi:MAG TPA: YraN family protein [Microthrixaceae bacterium]|nr:YraN family protein [Microthrixaceae bacterium]